MRKSIFVIIFNDKITYRINNKCEIVNANNCLSGTIIFNIDVFKKIIERIIVDNQKIINIFKPDLYLLFPYNKNINNYLKYVISPNLYHNIFIKSHRNLLNKYLKRNQLIVNNKYTSDYLDKQAINIKRNNNQINSIKVVNEKNQYYLNDIDSLLIKSIKEIII